MDDRLLTILQAAQQFNLSTGLLYTAVARGDLPVIRFRPKGRIRLRDADVREWIEGHISGATFPTRSTVKDTVGSSPTASPVEKFLPPQSLRRFA